MTIDEIKELINLVEQTGIAELELQRGDSRVRIRRSAVASQDIIVPAVMPVAMSSPAISYAGQPTAPWAAQAAPAIPATPTEEDRNAVVKSPIVGTYYDSPSPDAPTFVKVGDRVHPKQVLCIIESMKLMNEIESEVSGVIVAKLIENGRPVEYGEALFTVRPE